MPIDITIQPINRPLFDPATNRIIQIPSLSKPLTIKLEHSLIAVSKWESKWKTPFLSLGQEFKGEKLLDYIRCMTITQQVDPNVYYALSEENLKAIIQYIDDPMTATTIKDMPHGKKGQSHITVVTSEVIYYWMSALHIPFKECEKWHLNRLMTLIKIASIEQEPPKKMSRGAAMDQQRSIMAARRAGKKPHK